MKKYTDYLHSLKVFHVHKKIWNGVIQFFFSEKEGL